MTDPRGCLWPLQVSSRGWTVFLEAENWVNGPLKAGGHPQYFFGGRVEPVTGSS